MEIDREELLQTFLAEAEEQLDQLEQSLVALESAPASEEHLTLLFRSAHTLKGNASVVGFRGVVEFAHVVEDVLERLLNRSIAPSEELISLLLEAVDGLRQMVPTATTEPQGPLPSQRKLVEWLTQKSLAPESLPVSRVEAKEQSQAARGLEESRRKALRVDVDKLDKMLNLMGEITVARGRISSLLEGQAAASIEEIRDAHRDSDRLFLDLQDQVMKVRMVPLGPVFRQHIRTVRDLALAHDKDARLLIRGEEVEVDMAAVDGIRDPLMHALRNAVDHGLEPPGVRRARGKEPVGTITVSARYEGGGVLVDVSDDGAGLNRERILERGRKTGLVGPSETPSDPELFKLIFEPGFSTAKEITDLSGRGFGMDVVKKNVEALRGSVSVQSEEGKGTTLTMALPLTLAIIEGFSVGVGGQTYVLPLESVVECVELPDEDRKSPRTRGVLNLRGKPLPFLRLHRLFSVEATADGRESVVVIHHGGGLAGLAVDQLHGEGHTVIKPLPRPFTAVPGVSGAALLGNGRVALILDVPGLVKAAVSEEYAVVPKNPEEGSSTAVFANT